MAKNKKGIDRAEYPKLIKVEGKKVRVLNKEEEAKYIKTTPTTKDKADKWGTKE